jgi:hypothetical protein
MIICLNVLRPGSDLSPEHHRAQRKTNYLEMRKQLFWDDATGKVGFVSGHDFEQSSFSACFRQNSQSEGTAGHAFEVISPQGYVGDRIP